MIKKTILILLLLVNFSNYSLSAGTNSSGSNNYYERALPFIKAAKKYEAKGKIEKAKKRYSKALKILLKSNKDKPLQADTLNYLGFTSRKLGDYENGLKVNPNHKGINEYLGELYVATNRLDLAKERLEVLKSCNCEEYQELKQIIEGTKKSKY